MANPEAIILLPLFLGVALVYAVGAFAGVAPVLSTTGTGVLIVCSLCVANVVLARSVGYNPRLQSQDGDATASSENPGSLWHVSSAPGWAKLAAGDVVELDPRRSRLRALLFDRSRPWMPPRRAVYLFASRPTRAAASANLSTRRRRNAVLLELDPAGLSEPTFQRGRAVSRKPRWLLRPGRVRDSARWPRTRR